MNKDIGTLFQSVMSELHFNPHQTQRIFSFINKVLHKILSDPFLGSEFYKSSPEQDRGSSLLLLFP